MRIVDGTGEGYAARVTPDKRLDVSARSDDRMYYASRDNGLSFFYYSDVTPTGADDVFCYIQNTSPTRALVIRWIRAYCASAEAIDIYVGETGTLVGGTAITPVNLNPSSGHTAEGTFEEGVNITGLSGGNLLDRIRLEAGVDAFTNFNGLILGQSNTFTLHTFTGTAATEVTIGFYYE